jgi:hypothetical protein
VFPSLLSPSRLALLATHLAGNALLLAFGYWWLGTSESDWPHLLLSGASVLLFLAAVAWLQGLALACFCGWSFRQSASRAARHLLPLLALLVLAASLYALLHWAQNHDGHTAYVIGSYATMKARKPVAPDSVSRLLAVCFALLRWLVLPSLLFPLAAAISVRGWDGWRTRFLARRRVWLYALQVAALLLVAIWLPLRLFYWIPSIESFSGQALSFAARVGLGYLLFVAGVLAVEFFTSSGSPCVTQPSTAVSP